MGVAVVAYSHLALTDHDSDDWCEAEGHITAYAYDTFARSFEGLPVDGHMARRGGFIGGRCFAKTPETVRAEIMDTSYGGHGDFRRDLCRAAFGVEPATVWAAPGDYADAPFIDLVNFADNEGCIGPVSAARLLTAFADPEHERKWRATLTDPVWERYIGHVWQGWVTGLSLAVQGGLVRFS